uniref:ETS domain-containing protein n=1 Tax=Globodera pallida TaxID=36090 RepID=A0A183BMD2_GLOPA
MSSTPPAPLKPTDEAFLNYWLYNSYSPMYASPRDMAFNRNGSVYSWLLRKSYHSNRPGTYFYRPKINVHPNERSKKRKI